MGILVRWIVMMKVKVWVVCKIVKVEIAIRYIQQKIRGQWWPGGKEGTEEYQGSTDDPIQPTVARYRRPSHFCLNRQPEHCMTHIDNDCYVKI